MLLNACSLAYKSTGDVLIGYAEDQGVSYILGSDDVGLGCSMVEAFSPFLLSFSSVTTPPDHLAILFYLLAGNCVEFDAWKEELRYLRAIYTKKTNEAKDARIAQQRLLAQAARRQLKGYHYLTLAIAEPGAECPVFSSENEELYWLIGLLDGVQAVMNDISAGGSVEVPMDIASKVGRGAACLENEKWWGTPDAIQAAIWMTIPGSQPIDRDSEQVLENSLKIGLRQGISLPHVLATQVYLGQGEIEKVKKTIRSHYSKMTMNKIGNQKFKILNEIANLQIRAISDRLWTEETGARTPMGKIGSFWNDPDIAVETIDIGEILQ